ncbi:cytochrome o ubiquinol oxidase subunit IV [Salmonella enterica subsp. enterica serovar Senftenberg]|uniref:cytochrome o ubiquinol oxidase subunit IV n=1 Tax=Enterobacteriaceae TaxID=543 RepID=UPI0012F07883|nr:cytochrome o ubiquinol oxidase subunit IV [Salmonella enterica subsp. enterica serovar Senftenberg]ECZ1080622.1 cytochrome o ubiquinol oxidase subunit IV [Salmonella enterica]ECZ5381007.1 cytochrome o ubiquinol oxidase subunit IV [Salmonella enterica subsp. enterica serovar Senftenberg]EEK1983432.1 cytochrome o ubiquinol oxidase subunit IV [Salmonella enterica subsp. enterica serovar Senftenberg]EHA2944083.1 cytochrome o ubiquinol oxidase subunit IV [Salmonella enterica]
MNHSVNTEGAAHGSVKSYMTGFLLSVMLTAIPFWLVMGRGTTEGSILGGVLVCAVVQVLVHLIYFLHLNTAYETRWNLVVIVFTAVIIFIVITGSLWIMWNLNHRMV